MTLAKSNKYPKKPARNIVHVFILFKLRAPPPPVKACVRLVVQQLCGCIINEEKSNSLAVTNAVVTRAAWVLGLIWLLPWRCGVDSV